MKKRETYFSINECTDEELNQLRQTLYWDWNKDDLKSVFNAEEMKFLANCNCDDISFELLEKAFGGISFVDEDFWCNV